MLIDRDMKKQELCAKAGISSATLAIFFNSTAQGVSGLVGCFSIRFLKHYLFSLILYMLKAKI